MAVLPPNGSGSSAARSLAAGLVQLCVLVLGLVQFISIGAAAQEREHLAIKAVLSAGVNSSHMRADLLSEHRYLVAGRVLPLALRLQPDEGWHTYWRNPGDTGLEARLNWQLPEGFRAGEIEWPIPQRIDYAGLTSFGHQADTWLLIPVAIPGQAQLNQLAQQSPDGLVRLRAHAKWLVCEEVCIPGEGDFELALPVADSASQPNLVNESLRDDFALARMAMPKQLDGAPAVFSTNQQIEVQLPLQNLPVLSRQPAVFFANKGLVSNELPPRVEIVGDVLVITALKAPYFESAPHFVSMLLVTAADEDGLQAYDVLAEHTPKLVSLSQTQASSSDTAERPGSGSRSNAPQNLLYVLLLALLGGLILNAMPCVFPVLSLKVISLVEHGNHSPRERHHHGLAYTAGVISSFLLVAIVLMSLRSLGEQIGWGFQLQSPGFIAALAYVLFVLGLSLSGVIELGGSLQNMGQRQFESATGENRTNWHSSFFTGVLATVVATPCTAPFMGTAMGFALSQSLVIALLTFAMMGLGLALPFLLIAYIPAFANALPAPGNWMVRLKEILAFPIYLTVVWLLWVFSKQAGSDATALLLAGLVMLALAVWLWRVTLYSVRATLGRLLSCSSAGLALLLLVTGLSLGKAFQPATEAGAQGVHSANSGVANTYSPERLAEALADEQTVFVNMTADWCITCKVNERVALKTASVLQAFDERGIVYLKGDWTNSDPQITQYLESFSRNGVPLYVVYKPSQEPLILPQILTPRTVLEAL